MSTMLEEKVNQFGLKLGDMTNSESETKQQLESFKLPSPSRQDIVNWIAEGINYLKNHPDMIENSFRVRGITKDDPHEVRNYELLKNIMISVKDELADEEEELLEDEDPFSCV